MEVLTELDRDIIGALRARDELVRLDLASPWDADLDRYPDIGDHLAQVTGELYPQADDLGALTSTNFNANANRLNRLATRRTVLAVIHFRRRRRDWL